MKNALLITSAFPPQGGAGAQRMGNLCHYLPDHEWRADVITVAPFPDQPIDRELLGLVPDKSTICRSRSPNWILPLKTKLSSFTFGNANITDVLFPLDGLDPWFPEAIIEALNLHGMNGYDLLFASYPTPVPVAAGLFLKHRFRIPLIVDFRDPWVDNIHYHKSPRTKHRINKKLEDAAVQSATAVTVTNKKFKNTLADRKELDGEKIFSIPHGYDSYPGNVLDQMRDETFRPSPQSEKFRLISSGSIYPSRSLKPVIESLAELIEEDRLQKSALEFVITGKTWERGEKWERTYPWLRLAGFIPGISNLRKHMLRMNLAVAVLKKGTNSIPGRLQEYIGAGRPILLIADQQSAAADLVNRSDLGVVVDPGNQSQLKSVLSSAYNRWKKEKGNKISPDRSWIRKMHRPNLVTQFSNVFDASLDHAVDQLTIEEFI